MPEIAFDRFYHYADLTRLLQAYAAEYPELVRMESIGKSHEGREIWLMTITDFATGPDTDKPAMYVDGNIHASEVSASTACLYHLNELVTKFGSDAKITECLATRAFYLVPRLNPDGAEWALAERPKLIRSSTRPYPYDEDPMEGMAGSEDIDGDGRILTIRIPDPNGTWKAHPDEKRLLIRREPDETHGEFYRVLPEGRLNRFDGVNIRLHGPKEGLDLNRNFPMEWRQENEQHGAGPYPASEPEVRAVVDFFVRHNNICLVLTFHTYSGVILRPYASKADESFPVNDLWNYQKIGLKGTQITGYPAISIFHDFKYHPKQVITGGFDWAYEHLGMFFWVVELWSPQRQAGIKDYKYIDWFREHPVEDDLTLLKWNDEQLQGKGFVDWYPYDHPELGKVELGGWDPMIWGNPPGHLLEKEINQFPEWLVWQAMITPRLVLRQASAEKIGEFAYKVRLVIDNEGWLATSVTEKAVEKKVVRGVICEIELDGEMVLQTGKPRQEFGQLDGRANKPTAFRESEDPTTDRLMVEWIVQSPQGGKVRLLARHDRAGVVRAEIKL